MNRDPGHIRPSSGYNIGLLSRNRKSWMFWVKLRRWKARKSVRDTCFVNIWKKLVWAIQDGEYFMILEHSEWMICVCSFETRNVRTNDWNNSRSIRVLILSILLSIIKMRVKMRHVVEQREFYMQLQITFWIWMRW